MKSAHSYGSGASFLLNSTPSDKLYTGPAAIQDRSQLKPFH